VSLDPEKRAGIRQRRAGVNRDAAIKLIADAATRQGRHRIPSPHRPERNWQLVAQVGETSDEIFAKRESR